MPDQKNYILTLVAPNFFLDNAEDELCIAADICGAMPGVQITDTKVLSRGKAIDISIVTKDPIKLRADLFQTFADRVIEIDFCIQKPEGRRKKLLICDMDSTLIGQECIDELADFAGVKAHVSDITERAMRGELDFEAALTERVGLLKGLPLSNLQTCFDERIRLNDGAVTLAQTMKKHGALTVIVSGGFTFFTSRVAKATGFEHDQANTLIDDGKALTGGVGMPILGREAKKSALMAHSKAFGGPETAISIGDGANDLAMITASGLGIAYRAKPIVASAAHCAIDHTDLTTALYFQGFRDDEFA